MRIIGSHADADTDFGNELNMTRTVREYESRGVAAIQIEDQTFPKRCGHLEGKTVVPRTDFVRKITAAVEARKGDMLIIARTDARATDRLDEAIARMNECFAAGACDAALKELRTTHLHPAPPDGITLAGMFQRLGEREWDAVSRRFGI